MYIQPNSVIRLLTGVPLDNTYAHTIYFNSAQEQAEYFASKTKTGCTFNNQRYQRVNRGTMRLQVCADDIYDCNYLMFQNTSYGTKWFYAFVTSIEYVSNVVSEITYEIDVMQTWFFDVTLLQSFVEREHSATDIVGENLVPEPVNIGEYYHSQNIETELFDSYGIILCCPYKRIEVLGTYKWINIQSDMPVPPTEIQHQLTSLFYTVLKDVESVGQALFELTDEGKADSIVALYPVPLDFIDTYSNYDVLSGLSKTLTFTYFNSKPTSLVDYNPKNKKLLTYPYNKFVISTGDGNQREYAFEFFSNSVQFNIYSNLMQNVSFKAVPINYKNRAYDYEDTAMLTDFPLTGYINDSFKAWLAQNKTRLAVQTASAIVGGGIGEVIAGSQMKTPVTKVLSKKGAEMMAKGYNEMVESGSSHVGGILTEIISHGINRYHAQGSADGSLEISMQKKDFIGYQYSVNPVNAAIIDDFFSVYGYATHRVKVPNRNVRPHWTYVKTVDINIESNAPADDTNAIAKIYDKGITFWVNANEIGNYSLNNSPS